MGALNITVDTGDLRLLETAGKPALSNARRRTGESLTSHGKRLQAGDRANERAAEAKKKAGGKTRSGASQDFEKAHPRSRSGEWTLKRGASGDDVRAVQRRVGAKADGRFGDQTRQAVMDFQRKHGLVVDGVIGAQTLAAMRGDKDAKDVKPGAATAKDRRYLKRRVRELREAPAGVLALQLGEDLRLVEDAPVGFQVGDPVREAGDDLTLGRQGVVTGEGVADDGALVYDVRWDDGQTSERVRQFSLRNVADLSTGSQIRESFDLAVVDGHSAMLLTESAITPDKLFNEDGTIDFVIIRPCHGRGSANAIYEAAMLERDAHVFAGWPVFDNHEAPDAARARRGIPRPPSELAGQIRESWWDAAFETPEDGKMGFDRGAVIGRFVLTEDMERLVRRIPGAVKTSVNARPTSYRPVTRKGRRGMLVEGIVNDPENCSVDLVTKAGAGGQVAALYRELAAA